MFGRYQLQCQLGSGKGGVCYRALDPDSGQAVELWSLNALDEDDPAALARARRLRLAASLADPTARRVLELSPERCPSRAVLEWVEGPTLAEAPPSGGGSSWHEVAGAALTLARGMAEAHARGLAHGRLGPTAVVRVGPSAFKIDWSGLERPPASSAEPPPGDRVEPASDVAALGSLLAGWLGAAGSGQERDGSGGGGDPALGPLIGAMCDADPASRPTAGQVVERLEAVLHERARRPGSREATIAVATNATVALGSPAQGSGEGEESELLARGRLGRFVLLEKLGEGGMGSVYRGEDLADGTTVAVKVLRGHWARRPESIRRFSKEARLLAEVNNPYVTNLIEVNEDAGVHYLALEYVAGRSLAEWLEERGRLDEATALAILCDVARGLAVAHGRGVVHRDVKPENILVVGESAGRGEPTGASGPPRVKLSDFGLARHVVETESLNLTRAGAILGTPLYMAPEQCGGGGEVGPAADVYAMGATLFHLLAGRPPFDADSAFGLIAKHQSEPPPPLADWNEKASGGVGQIIAKALAKTPERRYADASEMLTDLERLLRGEPTGIVVHPRIPQGDGRWQSRFEFRWELEASPRQLWPHVSNTERLNRAIGLPAVDFTAEPDPSGGVRRFGRFRKAGVTSAWREHPFEWVEGRRLGVLREFTRGPFRWFVSIVELAPRAGGGTTLTHSVRLQSHGPLGRAVAAVEIGLRGRRALDRVYRRIDAALTGKLGRGPAIDLFEPPAALSGDRRRRLDDWLERLAAQDIDPTVIERLGDFLAGAPAPEVARIRPLALARRLGVDADELVAACLRGARDGTLILLWDILCPVCRIPSQVIDTLRALKEHGHCEACRLDFALEFAESVELIFRAHPELRETELGTYCIGGPAHSPHVVAQARVGAGERLSLDTTLAEGAYRLRGPQLGFVLDLRVAPEARAHRLDVDLARGPGPDVPRALRAGGQVITLHNGSDRELIVRLERTAARDDALTAARASSLPLFRELFPGEVLSPGQLISLATVTLLVTELEQAGRLYEELGDGRAFALVHEHFRVLDDQVRRLGGAIVKTVHEGIVAVFPDSAAAVEAALAMAPALAAGADTRGLTLRVGVHRGPAMVATLNDHLDYFGTTAKVASQVPGLAEAGGVVLTPSVASDPRVVDLLQARRLPLPVVPVSLAGLPEGFVIRLPREVGADSAPAIRRSGTISESPGQ